MFVWSGIIYKHRCVYNEKIKTGREMQEGTDQNEFHCDFKNRNARIRHFRPRLHAV